MTDNSRTNDPNPETTKYSAVPGDGIGKARRDQEPLDLGDPEEDVPTYGGSTPVDPYARSGRAAPQSIQPTGATSSETTAFERPDRQGLASDAPTSAADSQPTTVAPRPFAQSEPAPPVLPAPPTRSLDRPADNYADTDFAPVTQAPAETGTGVHPEAAVAVPDARRGTLDFGVLIIRVVIGAYLVARGVFTFFGLGGSDGLNGLETDFAGYQLPEVLAILIPSIELAAGVFLILGLMTPVAAAVATVATSFTALHEITIHEGPWGDLSEPVILAVLLTLVVIGLQFTGPGRISLDAGRGWARRPLLSSWIFVILGIALAGVLWWFGAGVNPVGSGVLPRP
ncbi:DoxX family protein [Corynebacterium pacaense]|uniref:DoxX family protein n=1 Tax=Corynebacterium pacaense TaxID=1816684 RepID=UPI0009B9F1AB|nr:DoxX family protein [Corynebacterium pacaense]